MKLQNILVEFLCLCFIVFRTSAFSIESNISFNDETLVPAVQLYLRSETEAVELYGDVSFWNVTMVTNMSYLFASSTFNKPLDSWDVSNVKDMSYMFQYSTFNRKLMSWDVGSVEDMSYMFQYSTYNEPLTNWDVSNVKDMSHMFSYSGFNQRLSGWNVSNVKDMHEMFRNSKLNQPLTNWTLGSSTRRMLSLSNFNKPLIDWDVRNVKDMSSMFRSSKFNQPLTNWDVSNVEDMSHMFQSSEFNQSVAEWDVSNVNDMSYMFRSSDFNQPLTDWDVSNVKDMSFMFYKSNINIPLSEWDVRSVKDMSHMFGSSSFNQPLTDWNISSLLHATDMFRGAREFDQRLCWSWDEIDVSVGDLSLETTVGGNREAECETAPHANPSHARYVVYRLENELEAHHGIEYNQIFVEDKLAPILNEAFDAVSGLGPLYVFFIFPSVRRCVGVAEIKPFGGEETSASGNANSQENSQAENEALSDKRTGNDSKGAIEKYSVVQTRWMCNKDTNLSVFKWVRMLLPPETMKSVQDAMPSDDHSNDNSTENENWTKNGIAEKNSAMYEDLPNMCLLDVDDCPTVLQIVLEENVTSTLVLDFKIFCQAGVSNGKLSSNYEANPRTYRTYPATSDRPRPQFRPSLPGSRTGQLGETTNVNSVDSVSLDLKQQLNDQLDEKVLINGKPVAVGITVTKDGPHLDGAAVLMQSILDTRSKLKMDIIALVHPGVVTTRPGLKRLGYKIVEYSPPIESKEIKGKYLRETIDKSGCCVLMLADVMVEIR